MMTLWLVNWGREGRVSAVHGIVGRVRMWERSIGKKGPRKWKVKKCPQSNARTVERGIKKKASLKL
jgi:hypothetical protein